MKKLFNIHIQKTKQTHRCFLDGEELPSSAIVQIVSASPTPFIWIETYENERLLLSGYFAYTNKKEFYYTFEQAKKAQLYL